MTELKSPLHREIKIGTAAYRLTIDPQGFKLVLKGRRKGLEIAWCDLVNGEAAMAVALRASLTAPIVAREKPSRRASPRSERAKSSH